MRTDNDIVNIRFELMGSFQLDMERVEEDPIWNRISCRFALEDPKQAEEALAEYIRHYLSRELLLEDAPMTNGPAAVMFANVEVNPDASIR